MRALLDLNVLIAMVDEEHIHFQRARHWWSENRADGWASCPLTQNGFLRVLSQPNYSNAISLATAFELLHKATCTGDHLFWNDDISLLDEERFEAMHLVGPKRLTDVYLLALAVKNGGRLATMDRAIPIAAVRGAEARHLVVI